MFHFKHWWKHTMFLQGFYFIIVSSKRGICVLYNVLVDWTVNWQVHNVPYNYACDVLNFSELFPKHCLQFALPNYLILKHSRVSINVWFSSHNFKLKCWYQLGTTLVKIYLISISILKENVCILKWVYQIYGFETPWCQINLNWAKNRSAYLHTEYVCI